MLQPRELLSQILEYILAQGKRVNPKDFNFSRNTKEETFEKNVFSGLRGIKFDIPKDGDHIWLRIERLEKLMPPVSLEEYREFLLIDTNPNGAMPSIDEQSVIARKNDLNKPSDHNVLKIEHNDIQIITPIDSEFEILLQSYLKTYTEEWISWAEEEKIKLKTIELYGRFFSIKTQIETEETANPRELVWGIGVSSCMLNLNQESFSFNYPILTQTVEITLNENDLAIEIRPKTVETRIELDAFIECDVPAAALLEGEIREHLLKNKHRIISPFDSSSYSDILRKVAGNLDEKGIYLENFTDKSLFQSNDSLIITDSWVILSRPKRVHYIIEDVKRLKAKINDECEIPCGPMAFVESPSDIMVNRIMANFRGVSSRGDHSNNRLPKDLFFPLPYNEEQVTIIQRLEHSSGVTVT